MKVALIVAGRSKKLIEPLQAEGVECTKVTNPFKKVDVDCIITDTPGLSIVKGWIMKKICKTKLIFRVRGNYWQEVKSEGKFRRIRFFINDNILMRLCDDITTVNYYLKKEILKHIIKNIYVVGVPIDINKFRNINIISNFNIVTVTNFKYFEKIKPLIEYADVINDFLMDVDGKWLVAGRGKYANLFVDKTKVYRTVEYCGYVNVPEFLSRGKVMVHLSEFEGLSNAVLEAMAAGLPVIVNNFEPLAEIDGTIVINNKEELVEWLYKLYENPKLITKISIRNKKLVSKKYNTNKIGKELKQIFT